MPSTLVTGANSFVAPHIIVALFEAGHEVTGSVRRQGAADGLFEAHPEWKEKLNIVVIPDYGVESNWDEVFKNNQFDHIVHVAAPLLDAPGLSDYERDFLKPTVEGNLAMLKSAKAHAPALKSIAVTGSVNALTTGMPDELKAGPLTNDRWLAITIEDAKAANNNYISYCSSKKESELAIWDFVKTQTPSFAVTVLLPALIFGPAIQALPRGVDSLNYSSKVVYSLMDGKTYDAIPPTSFPSYVDVRDLAQAHVSALTAPAAAGRRLLVGGNSMTYTDLVHSLAKVPALKGRKLPADSGEDKDVTRPDMRAEEGNTILGLTPRPLDITMADMAKRFLEIEQLA